MSVVIPAPDGAGGARTLPALQLVSADGVGTRSKPYRGPESYRVEDAALFFGRDADAEHILATVLSARFTLLHAPSGAGKSSLLNARLIPGLEARGWFAVRTTPRDDPTAAVRGAAIDQLLPPPDAELFAIRHAAHLLEAGAEPTLRELLAACRALATRDELRRQLAAPLRVQWPADAGTPLYDGPVTPFFTRLLRGSIDVDRFAAHVNAMHALAGGAHVRIDLDTRVPELLALIGEPPVRDAYFAMVAGLATFPVFGLRAFFEELAAQWGAHHPFYALTLILDQSEELFTRFIDAGAGRAANGECLDWRLRREFFQEIGRLYNGTADHDGPPLPIRCVVSIRNEFVAALDELRRIVPGLGESAVHLAFLQRDDARDAILQPAEDFGYAYDAALFEDVLGKLTREGEYVEPTQLQIVCEKLWRARGAALADESVLRGTGEPLPAVDYETYRALGGTEGILSGFFREYIDALSDADRLETIEMLEPLITSSGTRNIAEWRQLVAAPFRDEARREHLLYELARRNLVRFEPRLGGRLVEVTHEFLIPAIQEAIAAEAARGIANVAFRHALGTLEAYRYQDFRAATERLLALDDVRNLHANRDRIVWTDWATELMLRSAVARGAPPDVVREWAERYQRVADAADADARARAALDAAVVRRTLSLDELDLIDARRDALALEPAHVEIVLEAVLRHSDDREHERITWWTRRAAGTGAEAP